MREVADELEIEFEAKLSCVRDAVFKHPIHSVKSPPSEFYIRKLSPLVRQPLVRIRVEISGNWDVPNPQRFGQNFLGVIANASEILLYYRSKKYAKKTNTAFTGYSERPDHVEEDEEGILLSQNGTEARDVVQIPKPVQYYLYHTRAGGAGLKFLELDGLTRSVDDFVNKEEGKAISEYVSSYLKTQQSKTLEEVQMDESGLDENKIFKKFEDEANEAAKRVLKDSISKVPTLSGGSEGGRHSNQKRNDTGDEVMKDVVGKSENGLRPGSSVDAEDYTERELGLEDVHALVTSVPKLAQQLENCKPLAESDEADDDDISVPTPSRARTITASLRERGRGRTRGTGRTGGRGRGIDSYMTRKEPETGSERRGLTSTKNRRSTRHQASVMVDDSDEADEIQPQSPREEADGDQSDDIEFIPVSSTRKRRATRTSSAAAARSSQRQRAESATPSSSAVAPASGSRRSAFASRARTRRNTATIDVNEESGDDAM